MHRAPRIPAVLGIAASALLAVVSAAAQAIPVFARQYGVSCTTCHSAYPRLNAFGERFASEMNMRMPNWRDTTVETGDQQLALPKTPPFAVRAQAYVQARDAETIDPVTGPQAEADTDFQSPYLIKLLSSAPLSEHVTYYFYGIFAEKGENGQTLIEDAWIRHDDILARGVSMQLGQFQISDLMFPRETRLTFQDFLAYRMADITYDRGVILGTGLGPFSLDIGAVNGNGVSASFDLNSPGFARPDNAFDSDTEKTAFGRIGTDVAGVSAGLFGLAGEQKNATGPAGTTTGSRDTDKRIVGVDLSGRPGPSTYWFAQGLWNTWDGFLQPGISYQWFGGFAGIDYVYSPRWTYSVLYNYADANDLDDTDTVFEGIDANSVTLAASYYFMRNVKGIMEVNADLLDKEPRTGTFFTGHLTREHYLLFGFDVAF